VHCAAPLDNNKQITCWTGVSDENAERRWGSVLPNYSDEKIGKSIKEVLMSKHPDATTTNPSTLYPYDETPSFEDVDISHDMIEQV
jgi:hypothetical protein